MNRRIKPVRPADAGVTQASEVLNGWMPASAQ